MTSAEVLLVDDDPALLDALSEALRLRLEGLRVETCDSAAAALEQIERRDFDALVVDIKMPGMDGLELLREIRKRRPETPVLLITGHGDHDLAVEALRGGAHDYVTKPIDRGYFISSLSHAIDCHRMAREVHQQQRELAQRAVELEACVRDRTHELRELLHREQVARAELDEANRRLEAAQRQRAELIEMIAHDLAGPLTSISGYAQMLGSAGLPAEAQERARSTILSETRRLTRLVEDLADVAHVVTDEFRLRLGPCDLAELAREQVGLAQVRTDRHTIHLETPEVVPLTCDSDRLVQVLGNLLANAIQYTPGGEIRVRLSVEGGQVRVSVRDQGPGIPPEALDTIFEPRVRLAGEAGHPKPNGTGLGLHIARSIVQKHGGEIWVESTPGEGAEFNVFLPLASSPARGLTGAVASSRR